MWALGVRNLNMNDSSRNLKTLYVSFRDESISSFKVELVLDAEGESYTTETTIEFPNGKSIEVYVEVFTTGEYPDVSLYVTEDNEDICGLRCESGVILSYVTRFGYEVLLQVGSGPWE